MRFFISLVIVMALLSAGPVRAESQASDAIVVFDNSLSMWGVFGPKRTPKHQSVRDTIARILGQPNRKFGVGLLSFGHRRKSDCQDVELVLPMEPNPSAQLPAALQLLNPKGKAPLGLALREASRVAAQSPRAHVVAIFDGPDNCREDLCTTMNAIAGEYPGLRIHAIGIALSPADTAKTACIARMTGGRQFLPQDEAALALALEEAITDGKVPEDKPAPDAVVAKSEKAEAENQSPRLKVTAHFGAAPELIGGPVTWRIRLMEDADVAAPALWIETTAATLSRDIAPGRYEVEARAGLAVTRKTVVVPDKGGISERLELEAGTLDIIAHGTKERVALDGVVLMVSPWIDDRGVKNQETKDQADRTASLETARSQPTLWTARQARAVLVVPPGTYRVSVQHGLARDEQKIVVVTGQQISADFAIDWGRLDLATAEARTNARLDGALYTVAKDDPDAPQGRREIARSAARDPSFILPTGTYYLAARLGQVETRAQVAIGPGDVIKQTLVLDTVHVAIRASFGELTLPPDMPLVVRINKIGNKAGEMSQTLGQNTEFILSPGRYDVTVEAGRHNVTARQTLDVPSAGQMSVEIPVEAGEIAINVPQGQGFEAADAFWEIEDTEKHKIWRMVGDIPSGLLAPGRYRITCENRTKIFESAFEITRGARTIIEVRFP